MPSASHAVARDFESHRLFMIRSYGMALVLVWLRLMYDGENWLFFYVRNPDLRDATREWASWIVPLLGLELWLSWWPQLRSRSRRLQVRRQPAPRDQAQ